MINLPDTSLPDDAYKALLLFQKDIDAIPVYEDRVDAAKRAWPSKNHNRSATFRVVRKTLENMCSGHRRCCYCEDSCADEVEHICPKDIYPEKTFAWENYLYACGACNVEKRNNFAIFPNSSSAAWIDIKRKATDPVTPPPPGDSVLINPRTENPLDYIILDIAGTFEFAPLPRGLSSRKRERAKYTCEILSLNTRDYLVAGRKTAFVTFRSILHEYVALKLKQANVGELSLRIDAIKEQPHATVWHEMKRWHLFGFLRQIPELKPLDDYFISAPEALKW